MTSRILRKAVRAFCLAKRWQKPDPLAPLAGRTEGPAPTASRAEALIGGERRVPRLATALALQARSGPFVAAIALALAGPAFATVAETKRPPDALNLAEAREVIEVIARDESLTAAAKACPADLFDRAQPWWRRIVGTADIPRETCAANPRRCLTRCLEWSNAEACFSLAQAIEEHDDVLEEYRKEALFARACALGMGAGCTNRAAGIRNGEYEKDPFRALPEAERQVCQFRSFRADCERDGAWGCAMLGQSYQLGEGTEADLTKAREAFDKTCLIDDDFAACDFSREAIQAMDKPVEVDPEVMKEFEREK